MFVQTMKSFLYKFKKDETTGKILAVPEQVTRKQQAYDMWGPQIFVSTTRTAHATENMNSSSNTNRNNNGYNRNSIMNAERNEKYFGLSHVDQTPRTAALYATRENVSLNRINEFVNRRTPLHFDDDGDITKKSETNTNKKRKHNYIEESSKPSKKKIKEE